MKAEFERIHDLIRGASASFKRFSNDPEQVDPFRRITSIASILEQVDIPRGSRIADVGTGYGYGAVLLHSLGCPVIGLERNKAKLEEGLAYWTRLGVPFTYSSQPSIAFHGDNPLCFTHRDSRYLRDALDVSVDWATAFYISGYMLPQGAFDDVCRAVRPGGHFLVSTEGPKILPPRLRGVVARVGSNLFGPEGFTLERSIDAGESVHDRYVFVYKKAA